MQPASQAEERAAETRINILLVDDQPANLLALEAVLDEPGHNLVRALSGPEALRLLLEHEFAVILLDVQMAGMDGFETARLVRSRRRFRHVPIIFLTAHETNRLSLEQAYALGAVDYLIKPLVPVILKSKVAGFVDLYRKAEEVRRQAELLRQNERRELERAAWENQQALVAEQARLAAFGRDVGLALNRGDALPEMLRACAEAMVHYLRGAFARVWTLNEAEQVFELRASAGLYTHLDGPHSRVPVGKFKIGLIAEEREPHLTNAVVGDPRVGDQDWARREGMVSFAGYPLLVEGRVVGVMAMFARAPLSEATLEALASVANAVALGVERKWAEEALRRAHAETEARVRERTADLAAANDALRARAREQAAVAAFSRRALAGIDQAHLLSEAADLVAATLGVAYGRVMEAAPDGQLFVLRAGAGWRDGTVGRATAGAGADSLVGYTLRADAPVVCPDWRAETRFRRPQFLSEHGVVSSAGVVIPGAGRPFGVLGADATGPHPFSAEDLQFLQAIANVLATAVERKAAEEKVEAFAAELQRSNQELEQFASVASHDLQEPLRKIQAFGDRLQARCAAALGEQGRDYLDRMRAAAARMSKLINDLLAFSRVTTKAQPFADVDLALEARLVVADLDGRIQQTGGRVELGPLPTLHADPTQMRQLLQNLIGNALKFHRPGVAPVVRVGGRSLPDAGCELTVADNGIGFEEKYLDRVFQLFQRLHSRSEYEGTGIGLAICRKIVERHGGTITARSTPGQGATFVVTLPCPPAEGGTP